MGSRWSGALRRGSTAKLGPCRHLGWADNIWIGALDDDEDSGSNDQVIVARDTMEEESDNKSAGLKLGHAGKDS